MVARDEPLAAIPPVRERIAGMDHLSRRAEGECVEPGVERRVARDVDEAQIDDAGWPALQEVFEVILLSKTCTQVCSVLFLP
jgi:hypothetical protein